MTKDTLIEKVASKTGLSKNVAGETINTIFDAITNALSQGDSITITGFGTFTVNQRAARQGVNPRTGEKLQIPAMKVPKFKAGKSLKDAVR